MPSLLNAVAEPLKSFKHVTFFAGFVMILLMQARKPKTAKFLVIRFSAFGDVVQALSIPTAIRSTYPEAEVHWATRKDVAPLLGGHPHIQQVWPLERKSGLWGVLKMGLLLRKEQFTHIYDAHNNLRSRVLVFALCPLGFFGLGPAFIRRSIRRWKRFLLFQFRINKFEMPFSGQRDLLEPLTPWGISKTIPPTPQIFPNPESEKKAAELLAGFSDAIALAPSAAHFLKRWPKEYWKELILLLPNRRFVLLGGPEDSFLEDICEVAPERVLNLAGKCALGVSASVVSQSLALISNDTWLLHAAEQLGKKAIALMGPAPFGFPCRESTKVLELSLDCRPCSKHGQGPCVNKTKFHQCLVDITPAQVAAELKYVLGSRI